MNLPKITLYSCRTSLSVYTGIYIVTDAFRLRWCRAGAVQVNIPVLQHALSNLYTLQANLE
jgi:hypothetical protein